MLNRNLRSILGLLILAAGVYFLRDHHGSPPDYVLSTSLVLLFWYLNGLTLALTNLRTILFYALVFGAALLSVRFAFPTGETARMGMSLGSDLDPAQIARLKTSHAVALELYFDHRPTAEERYTKLGSLPFTEDGLHYSRNRTALNLDKVPLTLGWTQTHFNHEKTNADLDQMKEWFKSSFTYTLTPRSLSGSHPLDEFLFNSHQGFCEHYAASLATLLKIRGDQTRVAVGYAGGRWNPILRMLTYEDSDAHAWVEVLDPATAQWKLIDPTEWVMPEVNQIQQSVNLFWIAALAFSLISALAWSILRRKNEALELLIHQINRAEKKMALDSTGLTLAERISRLALLYPKHDGALRSSLSLYLSHYFASEPTKASQKALVRSLSSWNKL